MRFLRLTLPVVTLFTLPALAQDGPLGIAFVQAPEQSSGFAMGYTPDEAFARAVAICVEGGAHPEDCMRTNWCYPAGWSIDIFAQHQEGLHWHEVTCGLPERAVAEAVAGALCNAAERPYLIECALVQVYDPSGVAQITEPDIAPVK